MGHITAAHYFAGTLGFSMLRTWYDDADRNELRMAELRELLDRLDDFPNSLVLDPSEQDLQAGYAEWAATYDGPNPLIEAEERVMEPLLDRLARPGLRALDAACGTGRHAGGLQSRGCATTGVDQSAAMLAIARENVPTATFDQAEITALPYDDGTFDLITISLALCHLADPTEAIIELGRVLRPGGHLAIADPHPMGGAIIGGQAFYGGIEPPMRWVRNHYHHASTFLAAFRSAGLQVETCVEPAMTDEQIAASPAFAVYPEALRTALDGLPSLWVWVARRDGEPPEV